MIFFPKLIILEDRVELEELQEKIYETKFLKNDGRSLENLQAVVDKIQDILANLFQNNGRSLENLQAIIEKIQAFLANLG